MWSFLSFLSSSASPDSLTSSHSLSLHHVCLLSKIQAGFSLLQPRDSQVGSLVFLFIRFTEHRSEEEEDKKDGGKRDGEKKENA